MDGSLAAGTYAYKYTIRTQKEIVGGTSPVAHNNTKLERACHLQISYDGETEWDFRQCWKWKNNHQISINRHSVMMCDYIVLRVARAVLPIR